MMTKKIGEFLGAFLLVLAALLLTFKTKAALGWSPDLILPVLAAAALALDIYSLAFLAMLAAWLLGWYAGLPPELWLVFIVPLAAWLGKRFVPVAAWLVLLGVIIAGELAMYALAAPGLLLDRIGFILANTVFAALLGLILWDLIKYAYDQE